jgi:hypothetical protein
MMKYLLSALLAVMCSVGASNAKAGGSGPNGRVTNFTYFRGHIGLLVQQPQMINPDGCPRSDLYILTTDHPFYKEISALILAAHLSDQPLTLSVEGCGQGTFPAIQHVGSGR